MSTKYYEIVGSWACKNLGVMYKLRFQEYSITPTSIHRYLNNVYNFKKIREHLDLGPTASFEQVT